MRAKSIVSEVAQQIATARRERQLTQQELSEKSKVSLRTIQDLERGRRESFSESTLIGICRALDLDYREVIGEEAYLARERRRVRTRLWLIAVFVVVGAIGVILVYSILREPETGQLFTMPGEKLQIHEGIPEWEDSSGIVINYLDIKPRAVCGEELSGEIKWSYHFGEAEYFAYYASAYAEWDPENGIWLYDGIMFEDGSMIRNFALACPEDPGKYRIRIFFASPNAPISNFHGHDISNKPTEANLAKYYETTLEVE